MTQPLALIKGNLAIPLPRPYDGLPPPFGVRRRLVREAVRQVVEEVAKPAGRRSMFPPGVKHVLFYKTPARKVDTQRVDAALAEAKRYLEMGKHRPSSTRSDHLLAASIFAGCTIALTWLLVTCSMKDAEKAKVVSVTPPSLKATIAHGNGPKHDGSAVVATVHGTEREMPSTSVLPGSSPARVQSVAEALPPAPVTPRLQVAQAASRSPVVPKYAGRTVPHETASIAGGDMRAAPAREASRRVHVARLSEAHVSERVTLSQATRPMTRGSVSTQPEWNVGVPSSNDNEAPWLNWSAQQRRPSPTMRAATPVSNSWNDHMTQRRITDDPAAFHTNPSGQ